MLTDPAEDYARGYVPFLGVTVFLDSHPLIPRVETEWWVEKATATIKPGAKVLDLFAGSGCIGLAVLKHVPDSRVDFGEIEPRHFATIEKSLKENGIDPLRARMIETDIFSNITDRYDVILTNPPYIDGRNLGFDQKLELTIEPKEALYAEDGGFALIQKLLDGYREHLTPDGTLWVEHDPDQAEKIPGTHYPDQFGRVRYTVVHA